MGSDTRDAPDLEGLRSAEVEAEDALYRFAPKDKIGDNLFMDAVLKFQDAVSDRAFAEARALSSPPPEGPVCWVARDAKDGPDVAFLFAEEPVDEGGKFWGEKLWLHSDTAAALGLSPGECRAYRLLEVRG